LDELKKIDSLSYIALTSGGNDIDIEFIADPLSEFKGLVFEKVSRVDGVRSMETSLIVEIVQDNRECATAWDDWSIVSGFLRLTSRW
jgi:hypothetical protein